MPISDPTVGSNHLWVIRVYILVSVARPLIVLKDLIWNCMCSVLHPVDGITSIPFIADKSGCIGNLISTDHSAECAHSWFSASKQTPPLVHSRSDPNLDGHSDRTTRPIHTGQLSVKGTPCSWHATWLSRFFKGVPTSWFTQHNADHTEENGASGNLFVVLVYSIFYDLCNHGLIAFFCLNRLTVSCTQQKQMNCTPF